MASNGFFKEQCPKRGPGLTHMHDGRCQFHVIDQCCECGDDVRAWGARQPLQVLMPPMDVAARLRALGIAGMAASAMLNPEAAAATVDEHDDDTPVEPRLRDLSSVPTGPAWGRGRSWYGEGELHARDRIRLTYVRDYCPEMAENRAILDET